MKKSPYLKDYRLQDVIAALQFFAIYHDYDLTLEQFSKKIPEPPKSAEGWDHIFSQHPEFFRKSEQGSDYSLVLGRARSKTGGLRPALTEPELALLIEVAIHLQNNALEIRRENRAWLPIVISAVGIIAAFVGTIIGATLRSGG